MLGVVGRDGTVGEGRWDMGRGVWIPGRHLVILVIYKCVMGDINDAACALRQFVIKNQN